jgi:hypothetical protein
LGGVVATVAALAACVLLDGALVDGAVVVGVVVGALVETAVDVTAVEVTDTEVAAPGDVDASSLLQATIVTAATRAAAMTTYATRTARGPRAVASDILRFLIFLHVGLRAPVQNPR